MSNENISRRPLTSRDTKWAAIVAGWLVKKRIQPNTISVLSIVFACFAGMALVGAGCVVTRWRAIYFFVAAACIQLRLACNLFDGMVAVEGGFKTKSGEIYNELPDRFADVLILAGAGYSMPSSGWLQTLGWMAAALAVITAYVRAMGVAAGAGQYFLGPMAKPHRMAVMTVACLGLGVISWIRGVLMFRARWDLMEVTLLVICAGCLVTIARRVSRIARDLESK